MRRYARYSLAITLYLGVVQFAFLAGVQNPGNPDDFEKARLTELVAGTGYRPFVYRTLLPSTVRLIQAGLPDAVKSGVMHFAQRFRPVGDLFASTPAADEKFPVIYLIAYALEFGCLIGFALTLRSAIVHFYRPRPWVADLLPLGAVLGLPVFYRYITYDYDFPQLFLFSLGFVLLARRKWRWFYPVLVLGALNKETTVLLAAVHLLGNFAEMPRRAWVAHAAVQFAAVSAVRALLQSVIFAHNPGLPVEVWFERNWTMICDPHKWGFLFFHFAWVGKTCLVMPTNYNVLFLLVAPFVFWKWSERPVFLRRALWIAPLLVVLAMFIGQIDEMRVYYEAYVVVFLLAAGTVCRLNNPTSPGASGGSLVDSSSSPQSPRRPRSE